MQRLEIWYHNRLRYVLLDDEDYELCKGYRWHIKTMTRKFDSKTSKHEFVYTHILQDGQIRQMHLVRLILNPPEGSRVTFVSNNRLDLRKANLKVNGIRQDYPRPAGIPHWEILAALKEEAHG